MKYFNSFLDISIKAWFLRWLLGLIQIFDGLITVGSFGLFSFHLSFKLAKNLASHRLKILDNKKKA